jgi:hypothetical protein
LEVKDLTSKVVILKDFVARKESAACAFMLLLQPNLRIAGGYDPLGKFSDFSSV